MTMKIAFIVYDGMTLLDFVGVYDPLTRLKSMGFIPDLSWDICAFSTPVKDSQGLALTPDRVGESLEGYDLVVVPGGPGGRALTQPGPFVDWLRSAAKVPELASVCTGALLLGAAGFLEGKTAATHPNARQELERLGVTVLNTRLVEDGCIISSAGVTAGLDLGLYLCRKLAGEQAAEKIRRQMDYPWPVASPIQPGAAQAAAPRVSHISRGTAETSVEISLNLDGTGQHRIDTGLPFLDHMLTQVSVHGLFDLEVSAQGDLQVDPHHTVEDVALALGQAFSESLGNRAGTVRMAAAECPMDESLAKVVIDFSGRPYTIFAGTWHNPETGGIPASLFPHFLESFANQCRCNLHASLLYGRDDHHQVEALFKAFGRALSSASRIDPRRTGTLPSSKGILF